jgi:hypothetical protein
MPFKSIRQAAAVSPVRFRAGLGKQKYLFSQGKIGHPQHLHTDQQILQKRCLPAWPVAAKKGLSAELEESRQERKDAEEGGIRASGFRNF